MSHLTYIKIIAQYLYLNSYKEVLHSLFDTYSVEFLSLSYMFQHFHKAILDFDTNCCHLVKFIFLSWKLKKFTLVGIEILCKILFVIRFEFNSYTLQYFRPYYPHNHRFHRRVLLLEYTACNLRIKLVHGPKDNL